MPEGHKPASTNPTIDKALDSFEGLEKDWKELLDLVDKMSTKVKAKKTTPKESDPKKPATVKDDKKSKPGEKDGKYKQKSLFDDDEEADDEDRPRSDRVRKRVPVARDGEVPKGRGGKKGETGGKRSKTTRRPSVQTVRGVRQVDGLFRGSDEEGRGDDD